MFIYITNDGVPETKFRVHVYDIDSSGRYPGADITDSNVVLHANTGNEWVSVDLSSKRIPLGKGLFISIEWIEEHGHIHQVEYCMRDQGNIPDSNLPGKKMDYHALGGTDGYNKEGSIFYARHPFSKEWDALNSVLFNPMIYCTYNHIK